MSHATPGPLHGVVVVDLTRVLSGPYCTLVLADLGAEVIKIEPPGSGDESRSFPPFVDGKSAYFAAFNRGKKSLVLDLKAPKDAALFEQLLDRADVLVENYRPGVMERLGYGPETIAQRWPRLIHGSVSGFGQYGPMAQRPAYDLMIQAMSGIMGLTGAEGGPPARVGTSLIDIGSGMFAAIGVLAALHQRQTSGRGAHVDIAMLDSQVAMLEHALLRAQTGDMPQRLGARFPTLAPADAFATADGWIVIGCPTQAQFVNAMKAIGRPELADDARFLTNVDRVAHHQALKTAIEETLRAQTTAEWDKTLSTAGVSCGPVRTVDQLLDDPQLLAREMFVPAAGLRAAGNPIKISGAPPGDRQPAPALDGNRTEILSKLA